MALFEVKVEIPASAANAADELLLARDGALSGAVNLFVDVTHEQARELAEQAARCRRLARATTDSRASDILWSMAQEYAANAAALGAEAQLAPLTSVSPSRTEGPAIS